GNAGNPVREPAADPDRHGQDDLEWPLQEPWHDGPRRRDGYGCGGRARHRDGRDRADLAPCRALRPQLSLEPRHRPGAEALRDAEEPHSLAGRARPNGAGGRRMRRGRRVHLGLRAAEIHQGPAPDLPARPAQSLEVYCQLRDRGRVHRLRRCYPHRHIDAHQRLHPEICRLHPLHRDIDQASTDRHRRRWDEHHMILLIADRDRLGHRQHPKNGSASLAPKENPDRAHALEAVLVLSVDDSDKSLRDVVEIADERDALHQRVDQMTHPAFEAGFDRQPEQINQPDHHDRAERIGRDRGIRKVEADRDQYAADRAVRTEVGENERADPNDNGDCHRQREKNKESCDEGTEAADHRSPSVKRPYKDHAADRWDSESQFVDELGQLLSTTANRSRSSAARKSALAAAFSGSSGIPVASATRSMALKRPTTPAASASPGGPNAAASASRARVSAWSSSPSTASANLISRLPCDTPASLLATPVTASRS